MTTHNTYTLTTEEVAYEIVEARSGNGRDITIQNNNVSATVLIGGLEVTTSDYGFKILPNAAISFELDGSDSIWAVSETTGATVNVLIVKLEGGHVV